MLKRAAGGISGFLAAKAIMEARITRDLFLMGAWCFNCITGTLSIITAASAIQSSLMGTACSFGSKSANHWELWLRDPDGYTVVLASPDGTADGNWKP
jgi:hypothetical protein